jgi:hypothetical protein
MYVHLGYIIIILFIISITAIPSLGIRAEVSNNHTSFNETAEVSNNHTSFNETSITMINRTESKNSSSETCVMPKCPSEKVCIQVCPESLPPV